MENGFPSIDDRVCLIKRLSFNWLSLQRWRFVCSGWTHPTWVTCKSNTMAHGARFARCKIWRTGQRKWYVVSCIRELQWSTSSQTMNVQRPITGQKEFGCLIWTARDLKIPLINVLTEAGEYLTQNTVEVAHLNIAVCAWFVSHGTPMLQVQWNHYWRSLIRRFIVTWELVNFYILLLLISYTPSVIGVL